MKFFLAFVLIDLDEPLYRVAASEMIRSARRAYKDHDMRVVQLTDNRSERHPDVDAVFNLDTDVKGSNFCQMKGFLMAEFALKADRPVVFCDVDLLWNHDGILRYMCPEVVSCMWRSENAAMPINTGLVLSGGLPRFWKRYSAACEDLPSEVAAWYGDQFAMLVAWTSVLEEDREIYAEPPVRKLAMNAAAPAIDELPSEPLDTPAVHFKGDRKKLMAPYARLLDKGVGFEFARPNVTATIDFSEKEVGRMTYQGDKVAGFTF
jgi:hypothetical protein